MKKHATLILTLALLATLTFGCLPKDDVTLEKITLSGETLQVPKGNDLTLVATGEYSDGAVGVVDVEWQSNNISVARAYADASDASRGLITGLGKGTATITATAKDGSGVSTSVQITVTDPIVEGLIITPSSSQVALGLNTALQAMGLMSDGTQSPADVTWTSSNDAVATVSATGSVTGVSLGSVIITATSTDDTSISATAGVSVLSAVPVSLAVSPGSASVASGLTQTFTAEATFSDSTTATIPVTWSTSDALVATIDTTGLATAVSQGSVTITATSQDNPGLSGTATFTVTAPVIASLTVTPDPLEMVVTTSQTLTAMGVYTDGTLQPEGVAWSTDDATIATVDAAGTVNGVAVGSCQITATSDTNPSITKTVTVTIKPPFEHLYINCAYYTSGQGIMRVPYAGGAGAMFDTNYRFNISGLCISKDKTKVYLVTDTGDIEQIDIATGVASQVYDNPSYQRGFVGLNRDSQGMLYTFICGVNTNGNIYQIDPATSTRTVWATVNGQGNNIFDCVMVGNTMYVAYQGGIAKATQGGQLQTVYTSSAWFTSIDVAPDGTLYAVDVWTRKIMAFTDSNQDGYFFHPGEATTFRDYGMSGLCPADLMVDALGDIYLAEVPGTTPPAQGIWKLTDGNGDGDADDAGEEVLWSTAIPTAAGGGSNMGFK